MDRIDTAKAVLAKVSGREAGALDASMELVADLGIDSAKSLQLLADLEDALEIEIPDEEAARMNSVGDVIAYVRELA